VKGVLLAGGTGSRLHPLTKDTNKHLLPIAGRPMVEWAIEALVGAGVTEVVVVTGPEHVDAFRALLGDGARLGVDRLEYAVQERPGGIAEALGLAERFADGDKVVVVLADNVFERSIAQSVERFGRQERGARVLLAEVGDPAHLRHLGVPEIVDGRIRSIAEKPQDPPSPYAVTGVYFYDGTVFSVLPTLAPSARGELEITDVNNAYVDRGLMEYDIIDGFWGDAGESIDVYYAVIDFVRQNGANKPNRSTNLTEPVASLASTSCPATSRTEPSWSKRWMAARPW